MTLHLRVYDSTGQTVVGEIANPVTAAFMDELNGPGSGTVEIIAGSSDANLITLDAVMKVLVDGEPRQAWVVERIDRSTVTSDNRPTITASGRGVLSWLDTALVLPAGGLQPLAGVERPFNFADADAVATWGTPQGVVWSSDTTARAGLPQGWPDKNAYWIWPTSPTGSVVRGTPAWFKATFTLTSSKLVRFYCTADSQFELYLNGSVILSSSQYSTDYAAYQQFTSVTVRIPKGTHSLAAFARAGQPWTGSGLQVVASTDAVEMLAHGLTAGNQVKVLGISETNGLTVGSTYYVRAVTTDTFKLATTNSDDTIVNITADSTIDLEQYETGTGGFLLSAATLTDNGTIDTSLIRTNTTDWQSTATEPYFRPAMILKDLISEAQERGVDRLSNINLTSFGTATDTDGDAWTATTAVSLRVGSTLLDVHNELIEQGVDFRIRPSDLRLEAFNDRGTDRSGQVRLEPGHTLQSLTGETERPVRTMAVIRTPNGWATAAVGSGRRETYLETSGAASDSVARDLAEKLLEQTSLPLEAISGLEFQPQPGVIPYVDFGVGDVIGVPAADGTWERARVLSLAATLNGNDLSWSTELSVLNGTQGMRRPPRLWEQSVSARLRAIAPGAELGATITAPQPSDQTQPEPGDPTTPPPDVIALDAPSTPDVTTAIAGINVKWDGEDTDGDAYPPQAYVQVHVSTVNNFTPSESTERVTISRAGTVNITGLTPGTMQYVKLVGVTEGGSSSAASAQDSAVSGYVTSDEISFNARDLGGIAQYVASTAPTGGTYYQGDTWINTTNLTYNVWSGSAWVKQEWGTAAISAGAITAAQIAAGAVTADKIEANAINGKTITGAVIRTGSANPRIELSDNSTANDSLVFFNSSGAVSAYLAPGSDHLFVSGKIFSASEIEANNFVAFAGIEGANLDVTGDVSSATLNVSGSDVEFPGVYTNSTTGLDAVGITAAGRLRRDTSVQAIKYDISPIAGSLDSSVDSNRITDVVTVDPTEVLNIAVTEFSVIDDGEPTDRRVLGFIAEDVAAKLPIAVTQFPDGSPSGVLDTAILASLLAVVQEQQATINDLRTRIEALEA